MVQHEVLANILYAAAIQLKRYNPRRLLLPWHRNELRDRLRRMQTLLDCMRAAPGDVRVLQEHALRLTGLRWDIPPDRRTAVWSPAQRELAAHIAEQLRILLQLLKCRPRGYRTQAAQMLPPLHNLFRPFLSPMHPARITPEEARRYAGL